MKIFISDNRDTIVAKCTYRQNCISLYSVISAHCVTTISREIITILLHREICQILLFSSRLVSDCHM
jgi:hypothetical protein